MKKLFLLLFAGLALQACSDVDIEDASAANGVDQTRAISPRTFYAQLDAFVGRYQMQTTPSDRSTERMHKLIFATALGHYLAEPDPQNRDLYSGIYQSWRIAANTQSVAGSLSAEEELDHYRELLEQSRPNRSIEPMRNTRFAGGWGDRANELAAVLPLLFAEVEGELAAQILSVNDRVKMMYVCDLLPAYLNAGQMDFTDYILAARVNDPLVDAALANHSDTFFTFEDGYEWLWTNYPGDMYLFDMLVTALPVIAAQASPGFIGEFGEFCQNPDYYDFVPEDQFPRLLVCLALANEAAMYWGAAPEPHSLTVDPTVIEDVTPGGGTFTVQVTSTSAWTAEYSDRIFAVTPSRGEAGVTTMQFKVQDNLRQGPADKSPLVHTITFQSGADPVVLEVHQAWAYYQSPKLTVNPVSLPLVEIEGGTYTLEVTSNTPWTSAVSRPNNVLLNPSEGPSGTTRVTVTIPPCNLQVNHSVTYTVTFSSLADPVLYDITQLTGFSVRPSFYISPEVIDDVPVWGDTYTISLASSADWRVSSLPEGVVVNPSSGPGMQAMEVEVTVPANSVASLLETKRTLPIEFTNGNLGATLTIYQKNRMLHEEMISVFPASMGVPVHGGIYSVNVTSQGPWTMHYYQPNSYISASPASGSAGTTRVDISLRPYWIHGSVPTDPTDNFEIIFSTGTKSATLTVYRMETVGETY